LPPGNVSVVCAATLSKVSVDEVFMHYFEKMLSASGSFTPRLPPGLCRWTLLGDFRPSDPLIAHPWKKYPARAHVNILQKWPNFRLTWFGSAYHTQI